jgi:zinc D-Ala-D-Ala carboxypeptidase
LENSLYRNIEELKMKSLRKLPYLVQILGIATIVAFSIIISGALLMRSPNSNPPVQATNQPTPANTVASLATPSQPEIPTVAITNNPTPIVIERNKIGRQQVLDSQPEYGHFPYAQADPNQMMLIGSYAKGVDQRFESLHPEAGKALMQMIYAARDEGVWIVPVSGFRTLEQQEKLFQRQIKRRGSAKEAAKLSAPPGHSEHHTGYAVDVTDGKFPQQDITFAFEKTDAYRWLSRHAQEYGFELSFPQNNSQGVSFEPWHWRYIGSPNAAAIFAHAKSLR